MKRLATLLTAALMVLTLTACGSKTDDKTPAGGDTQPKTPTELVLGFVPSSDAQAITEKVKPMADYLSSKLGIPVKPFTATNYVGLVEAMGSEKVDIGYLPPFGYVLANSENGAQVILQSVRQGASTYKAQFVVRADSGITKVEDLKGKRFAFVDPGSASGYLFPANFLKSKGMDPDKDFSKVVFSGGHDTGLKALYNSEVDGAVSFTDARERLLKEHPDVMTVLKVIDYTTEIPNDTVSVRKGLPADLVTKIQSTLLEYAGSEEGKKVLKDLYQIDGFAVGKDSNFDVVRSTAEAMNIDLKTGKPKK